MFIFLLVSFLEIIYGIFKAMYGYREELFFTFFGLGLLFLVLSVKQKEKSEISSALASLYFGFGSIWFGAIYSKGDLTSWLFVAVGALLIILSLVTVGYYLKGNRSKNALILFSILLLANIALTYYEMKHSDCIDLKYSLPAGLTLEYRLKSETKVGSEVKKYVSRLLMEISNYTSGKYEIAISTNSDVSNIIMDGYGNIVHCNNCYPLLSLKPILLPTLHRAKLDEKWVTHLSDSGMYETARGKIRYDAMGVITYTFEGVDKISTSLGVFKCYLLSVNGSIHTRGVIYTNSAERIPFTTNESFKGFIALTDKGYILKASYKDSITQLLDLSYSYKNKGFLEDFYRKIKSESHIDIILINKKSVTNPKQ